MTLTRLWRRHRVALASAVVLVLAAGALTAYALASRGYPVRHVDLDDGGIWVTNDVDGLFGRLNKPAGALDAAVNPPGGVQSAYDLDVAQQGAAVAAWNRSGGELVPVDVTTGTTLADAKAPVASDAQVAMAGGTLAVLDPRSGAVRAMRVDPALGVKDLSGLDASAPPVAKVDAGTAAALTVGVDGVVHAVGGTGRLVSIAPTSTGWAPPVTTDLHQRLTTPQITAVGGRVVVLDPSTGTLVRPDGGTEQIGPDPAARLQAPSPGDTAVDVATSTALLRVPLDGGAPDTLFTVPGAVTAVAAPFRLGDCVHAAWAARPGIYARSCGGPAEQRSLGDTALVAPTFRSNRNAVVLNDSRTGVVFDVDDDPRRLDNWTSVKPPPTDRTSDDKDDDSTANRAKDKPPEAKPDTLGARPGRTTVLHVLDNDSDPQGYILSVRSVTASDDPRVRLSISPDGQTVQITTPADARDVNFSYTVDDGRDLTATTDVTVKTRPAGQNEAPAPRVGYVPPAWTVPAGGRLSIPTLADWRDFDGDPLFVTGATGDAGTVSSTPDGRIEVVAPPKAGTVDVRFEVSDGFTPTAASLAVTVLDPAATTAVPATAQPDVARGEVGRAIVIRPLDNDLPGADPANPAAVVVLAGDVASPGGTNVVTDTDQGTVTVTAGRAGVVSLKYQVGFGNAAFATGAIRVDVVPAPATPQPPVAMPDTGVLYGQNPAVVDVLANDFDPAGAVLVVQHAEAVDASSPVQVAILSGRFLRVSATSAIPASTPVLLRYTVADGLAAPATGEVTLTAQPEPAFDVPVTRDDVATVRAGDLVTVPVLDNDSSPAGSPLSLLPVVPGLENVSAGQLRTTTVDGKPDDISASYVAGNLVRYVAPANVTAPTVALVDYVAVNPDGQQATGHIRITVTPPPGPTNPDRPPVPAAVETRVVAGDTVHITVPTTGVDPDGDSVSVVGLAVPQAAAPPKLGRVVKLSATTIDYQAFPTVGNGGTDTFSYRVTDRYGETGDAVIRVAVVQPGDPQPPVAVDDTVTAAPGMKLSVDVLANDLRSPGDDVAITPLDKTNPDLAGAATLESDRGPIDVTAPDSTERPLVVLYAVGNGLAPPSVARLTVRSVKEYDNPPIAADAFAPPQQDGSTVTVDVGARVDDIDSDLRSLKFSAFDTPDATFSGGKLTVKVGDQPQTIPYQVEDEQGAVAAAVVHVPAAGRGAPYVKDGARITLDKDARTTVSIADYLVDPAGKPLTLTVVDRVWSAPGSSLAAKAVDTTRLELTGRGGYAGPASVTVEVTDGKTLDDPDGVTAVVTIPVQVGPETPVLRCPSTVLPVVEGGNDLGLDITSLCHVWVADPDPAALDALTYDVNWKTAIADVDLVDAGQHRPAVRANTSARPGAQGVVSVTVAGTEAVPATLAVTVIEAPRPTIAPISVDGFKASDTARFDLTGYVTSQLRKPVITVVSVTRTDGEPATATASGSQVEIKPGNDSQGSIGFAVVVSDVPERDRVDRQVTGRIVLNVLNVPDAPSAPVPDRSVVSHTVTLSWATPAANGSPIESYRVTYDGGERTCPSSPCTITGLDNGRQYRFAVVARNAVGDSRPSGESAPAQPNAVPEAVTGVRASDPEDGRLTLTWTAAKVDGTPVTKYLVAWQGGSTTVTSTTATPTGLDNNTPYTFSVTPVNQLGPGPAASAQGQSAGAPPVPGNVQIDTQSVPGDRSQRAVRLTWDPAGANGPGPTTYTVYRNGTALERCSAITTRSCTSDPVPNNGDTYRFQVEAANQAAATKPAGHTSVKSDAVQVEASDVPEGAGFASAITASTPDGQAPGRLNWGPSYGGSNTITCSYSGGSCGSWPGLSTASGSQETSLTLPASYQGNYTLRQCNGSTNSAVDCKETTGSIWVNGPPSGFASACNYSGSTAVITWDQPATTNGRTLQSYRLNGDGISNASVPPSQRSYSQTYAYDGASHTITITATDQTGSSSSSQTVCQDPPPQPVAFYQVTSTNGISDLICRGNPGKPESMPGGRVSQRFVAPYTGQINQATVQIDDPEQTVTARGSIVVNGVERAAASVIAYGDTTFNFGSVGVNQNDTVDFVITFTASSGKLTGVYAADQGSAGYSVQNSCSDGARSVNTTSRSLKATVSGTRQ